MNVVAIRIAQVELNKTDLLQLKTLIGYGFVPQFRLEHGPD